MLPEDPSLPAEAPPPVLVGADPVVQNLTANNPLTQNLSAVSPEAQRL